MIYATWQPALNSCTVNVSGNKVTTGQSHPLRQHEASKLLSHQAADRPPRKLSCWSKTDSSKRC